MDSGIGSVYISLGVLDCMNNLEPSKVTLHTPFKWGKHNLTVIGDGYTSQGVRIHLVQEDNILSVIDNAVIISKKFI